MDLQRKRQQVVAGQRRSQRNRIADRNQLGNRGHLLTLRLQLEPDADHQHRCKSVGAVADFRNRQHESRRCNAQKIHRQHDHIDDKGHGTKQRLHDPFHRKTASVLDHAGQRKRAAQADDRIAGIKDADGDDGHRPQKALRKGNGKAADVVARQIQHRKRLLLSGLISVQQVSQRDIDRAADHRNQRQGQQRRIDLLAAEADDDRTGQRDPDGHLGEKAKVLFLEKTDLLEQVAHHDDRNEAGCSHDNIQHSDSPVSIRRVPRTVLSLHLDDLVFAHAQTDLLGVIQAGFPLGVRRRIGKRITPIRKARLAQVVPELAVRQRRALQARIHACLIQRQRIKGGKHADIRQDRRVVLAVAVAVRRDILNQRDVEMRTAIDDRLRVLGHAAVEHRVRVVADKVDRVKVARAKAAAAAQALILIDAHLAGFLVENQAFVGAELLTELAAAAVVFLDDRLAVVVLLRLARAGTAAHADVLDRAAKARGLVAFEMRQADEDIRIL